MMTLERIKYLESITEREKALREEIDVQKSTLGNIKFRLAHSESRLARRIYKGRIKYQKFVICALKHELERIQPTTDIEYIAWYGCTVTYKCCNCRKEFTVRVSDDIPSHCSHCHRKIERE